MGERPTGPVIGELGALEMHAHPSRAEAHPVVLGDPVAQLPGRPGAVPLGDFAAHGVQDARRQGGVVPATRFVGQGRKAAGEKRLDPGADGLLVLSQVAGDLRHAPARIGEADHLQPIAGAEGKPSLPGALVQVSALLRCQHDSVHEPEHTRFYELWPLTHLAKKRLEEMLPGKAVDCTIAFLDDEAAAILRGKSWVALAAHEFGIEPTIVPVEPELIEAVKVAQRRQDLRNDE